MMQLQEGSQYLVPMRWTCTGWATVEALSEKDAIAKANQLDCELPEGVQAEVVDWAVTGDPEIA